MNANLHKLQKGETKMEEEQEQDLEEEKRLLLDVTSGLEEPVEERSAMALVHGHVASILAKAHGRLARELNHEVGLVLLEGLAVEVTCNDASIGVTRRRVGEERERSRRHQVGNGRGRPERRREE
ncbi:hypothetical protein Cni_G02298 [Canna indica]|uniref:Uncharacterized protein n=1 Tax=Canna indica TaxID=4628 RepID=A0AAQ3JQQ9_9LILI|nr:hypothetical protein Cni_G02298 [Canna indica]